MSEGSQRHLANSDHHHSRHPLKFKLESKFIQVDSLTWRRIHMLFINYHWVLSSESCTFLDGMTFWKLQSSCDKLEEPGQTFLFCSNLVYSSLTTMTIWLQKINSGKEVKKSESLKRVGEGSVWDVGREQDSKFFLFLQVIIHS